MNLPGNPKHLSIVFLVLMTIGCIGLDQLSKIQSERDLLVWQSDTNNRDYRGRRLEVFSLGTYNRTSVDPYLVFSVTN